MPHVQHLSVLHVFVSSIASAWEADNGSAAFAIFTFVLYPFCLFLKQNLQISNIFRTFALAKRKAPHSTEARRRGRM